jgi:class 3 adenylate cyclase
MVGDLAERGVRPPDVMPPDLLALLEDVAPMDPPPVFSTDFHYVHPEGIEELGGYTVKVLTVRLRDHDYDGGWLVLFDVAVPPRLVSLLARGDPAMYERMARLVQPGRRAAAILFCDLQGSGVLSRKLPTADYFGLVRRLWTAIDATVAEQCGVVGKHAGDGASAFFLAEDLGGDSPAARAAIVAARQIHEVSGEVFREVVDLDCLMRIGLHWGDGLYMGQLVPGGRLDITALGDEVNEAARIEEVADAHETLASKQLLERLTPDDAAVLGLGQPTMYRLVSELAPEDSKVVRDAGTIAVTSV